MAEVKATKHSRETPADIVEKAQKVFVEVRYAAWIVVAILWVSGLTVRYIIGT